MNYSTSQDYHTDYSIPQVHQHYPVQPATNPDTTYGFRNNFTSLGEDPPTYEQVLTGNHTQNTHSSAHNTNQSNHYDHHTTDIYFPDSTQHLSSGIQLTEVTTVPSNDPRQQNPKLTKKEKRLKRRQKIRKIRCTILIIRLVLLIVSISISAGLIGYYA